jgi:hypothetical protein
MDVYVYQADLYCLACGNHIRRGLKQEGIEDEGDSETYPQKFADGGGEADSPQHCGNHKDCIQAIDLGSGYPIGAWLENPLTEDGIRYVATTLASDFLLPNRHKNQVANLWRQLYHDELQDFLEGRFIEVEQQKQRSRCFLDADHYYHVDLTPNLESTNTICRWDINDDTGALKSPRLVTIPEQVMKNMSVEDVLRDTIDEGAFD